MRPETVKRRASSGFGPMSAAVGIGLKPAHYHALLTDLPPLDFLEVHTENYMGAGGPPHRYLAAVAERYALSFHGVGLSLGGTSRLRRSHLTRWRELVERYQPALVSEHVAWSSHGGHALHDLLPIPYTEESLRTLCGHIDQMQDALGRHVLIENPARYLEFNDSTMAEAEFLVEATTRTGCRLLLDLNNVFVSACNQGEDARPYLTRIPGHLVEQIHLAGHSINAVANEGIRIDDHGSPISDPVWQLYRETVACIGTRPTLIEWDTDVPDLGVLLDEADRAREVAAAAAHDVIERKRHARTP